MNLVANLKARDLLAGKEISISGDGYNEDITASASIVDGKPLYFLSTYSMDGNSNREGMVESISFRTLKALKEAA